MSETHTDFIGLAALVLASACLCIFDELAFVVVMDLVIERPCAVPLKAEDKEWQRSKRAQHGPVETSCTLTHNN